MRDAHTIEIEEVKTNVEQGEDNNGPESGQNNNKNIDQESNNTTETEPYSEVKNKNCSNTLIAIPMVIFTASLVGFVAALNNNEGPDSPAVWGSAASMMISYGALVAMRYAKANNSNELKPAASLHPTASGPYIGLGKSGTGKIRD